MTKYIKVHIEEDQPWTQCQAREPPQTSQHQSSGSRWIAGRCSLRPLFFRVLGMSSIHQHRSLHTLELRHHGCRRAALRGTAVLAAASSTRGDVRVDGGDRGSGSHRGRERGARLRRCVVQMNSLHLNPGSSFWTRSYCLRGRTDDLGHICFWGLCRYRREMTREMNEMNYHE